MRRYHSSLRTAWGAPSRMHRVCVQSTLRCQRARRGLPCPLSRAPRSQRQLERFPLPVKCGACGVCICLWSHFAWDYLIVPHAGSVYLFTHQTPAPPWHCLFHSFINRKKKSPLRVKHIFCPMKMFSNRSRKPIVLISQSVGNISSLTN